MRRPSCRGGARPPPPADLFRTATRAISRAPVDKRCCGAGVPASRSRPARRSRCRRSRRIVPRDRPRDARQSRRIPVRTFGPRWRAAQRARGRRSSNRDRRAPRGPTRWPTRSRGWRRVRARRERRADQRCRAAAGEGPRTRAAGTPVATPALIQRAARARGRLQAPHSSQREVGRPFQGRRRGPERPALHPYALQRAR